MIKDEGEDWTCKLLILNVQHYTEVSPEVTKQLELPTIKKVNLAISGFLQNNEVQSFNIVTPLLQLGKYE